MITPHGPHVERTLPKGMHWRNLALRRVMHAPSDVVGSLQLAWYFGSSKYDIVHTHNIKAGHIGRVVAAAMRVPIVVHTLHGMAYSKETPPLRRTVHATLEKIASLGCDMVFSQSREDVETYLDGNVIAPEKLTLIGNGINLQRFDLRGPAGSPETREKTRRELGIADDEVLFVSAGRLIVEKGFVELFEATALARRTDARIRLLVAGPVDDRSDALDSATLEGARAQGILLPGRWEDMPGLYAAADVVTLPSWHEGMPRVLMEGAAMGNPLLATDARGCREIVVPPRNGLLVPVRDARALAQAMIKLAADRELRERLGRENAEEARERYAIERSVGIVNDAYDRLLARVGRR